MTRAKNDPARTGMAYCMYCDNPVDVVKAWTQTVVFVHGPDLALRNDTGKDTGKHACHGCVDKVKAGLHPMGGA